jgi:ADP-heptose:LPS heptosyltransferase
VLACAHSAGLGCPCSWLDSFCVRECVPPDQHALGCIIEQFGRPLDRFAIPVRPDLLWRRSQATVRAEPRSSRPMPPVSADLIQVFVGRDLIGDGVMKLPFLRVMRLTWPRARILWLAAEKSVFASTLRPLSLPLLDEVIEETALGLSWSDLLHPRVALPRADLLIDTQRHVRTSLALRRLHPRTFVSAAAGWRLSALKPVDRSKPPSMLAQMLRLLEACGAAPDLANLPPLALAPDLEAAAAERLPQGSLLVGLAPGAGDRRKCWPLSRFIDIGRVLTERGVTPVVLLGPAEREWAVQVASELPSAVLPIRAADSPLLTMAIARRLSVAVANDSGIGHLIAAAGIPLISLFGPTAPEKFAPAASRLAILRAQDFGGRSTEAVPAAAVLACLADMLPPASSSEILTG